MASLGELVRLHLWAPEDEWGGLFDTLRVWRAWGPCGPFRMITSDSGPLPPSLFSTKPLPQRGVLLSGEVLEVELDGERIQITFQGSDPLSLDQVTEQIKQASEGRLHASLSDTSVLVLSGTEAGPVHTLRAPPSTAALRLALPSGLQQGKAAALELVAGTSVYEYIDPHGSKHAVYRTQYCSSVSGASSELSESFSAAQVAEPADVVIGYVDLVDGSGQPVEGREVLIETVSAWASPHAVVGTREARKTDRKGRAAFRLLRGLELQVGIAGTRLSRRITTPTDPDVKQFHLLGPEVGADDLFAVRAPNVDFAIKSSL